MPISDPVMWWLVVLLGLAGFFAWRSQRRVRGSHEPAPHARRSVGNAMLVFQEFTDPGVAHVIEAQQDQFEDDEEPDDDGGSMDEEDLHAELVAALEDYEIDCTILRSSLTRAARCGLDWRAAYGRATTCVFAERPYLAPKIPPPARVAPLG